MSAVHDHIEGLGVLMAYYDEAAFFEAWFEGVSLAGWRWFGDGQPDNKNKQNKWEFAPRVDDIESAIGALSSGEAAFLAAMVSFYSSPRTNNSPGSSSTEPTPV